MKVLELETYTIDKKVYKHESNSIVATEKMMMKNSSETVVEKKYIKKNFNKTGNIFVYVLKEKFMIFVLKLFFL